MAGLAGKNGPREDPGQAPRTGWQMHGNVCDAGVTAKLFVNSHSLKHIQHGQILHFDGSIRI